MMLSLGKWLLRLFVAVLVLVPLVLCFCQGVNTGINALVAVGTLAVAIVAIFGDWVRAWLIPPRLKLELRPASLTPQVSVSPSTGKPTRVAMAWYFGLDLVNLRTWRRATNCRVLLAAMYRVQENGALQRESMSVPLQYQWALPQVNPALLTISLRRHAMDFGVLAKAEDGNCNPFTPCLYVTTFNFKATVSKDERAWYFLEVAADDMVAQQPQVFEVHWDGEWSDKADEIGKHLAIREVPTHEVEAAKGGR